MMDVYYFPFVLISCWNSDGLQSIVVENNRLALSSEEQTFLYKLLDQRSWKERFDAQDVRLFIPAQRGRPEYAVDGKGVVRTQGITYSIKPLAFLRIAYLLDPKLEAKMQEYSKRRQ